MKNFLFLLTLFTSLDAHTQKSEIPYESILKELVCVAANEEIKNSGAPSLQIAVGYKDSIIFTDAYGLADIENDVHATVKTKYRIASVTKLWTSIIALMLAERGKLDLDAPVQLYCSSFPEKSKAVTARQLLTHTAGIRSYIDLGKELRNAATENDSAVAKERYKTELIGTFTRYTSIKKALDNFKYDPLIFEPGNGWEYSSQGYRILGCAIEGATGRSYQQLTKELIFEPTGMENTTEDDAWAIIPHRASGYRIQRGQSIRRADMRDVSENLPAGGHLSTAADLILFANAFLNSEFVPSPTAELMTSPFSGDSSNLEDTPVWRYAIPSRDNYGYGVMIFPSDDTRRFGHTGRQAGGSAILMMIPEKHLSIAILTNAKGWNGYISFAGKIEEIVMEIIANRNK